MIQTTHSMRKFLRLLSVCGLLTASLSASAVTFREKYNLDKLSESTDIRTSLREEMRKAPNGGAAGELVSEVQGTRHRFAMSTDIFLSGIGATHIGGFGADMVVDENAGVAYTKSLSLNFFQQGYSAGEIKDDEIVFHSGQYIYDTPDNEKAYLYAAYLEEDEEWPVLVDDFVLVRDEKGRYVSLPGYYFMVLTEEEAESGIDDSTDFICFGCNYVLNPLPDGIAEEFMPDDAQVSEVQMMAFSLSEYGASTIKEVSVGVSGDKIYIGGLSDYLPESWLVGEKADDESFIFKTHQYLGYYDSGDYPYIYEFSMVNPVYFDGESLYFQEVDSVRMNYNADRTALILEEGAGVFVNSYADKADWHDLYWGINIGDFNKAVTPSLPVDFVYYTSWGAPYVFFGWNNVSIDGMPLVADKLWCEVFINGEPYVFKPEYYRGLTEPTEKLYYNMSGVDGLYPGDSTTLYFNEFEDNADSIKVVGVRIGYSGGDETRYTDIIYAPGYEPFEDKAAEPASASQLVFYKDYYSNIMFKFEGNDTDGNKIPDRLLAVEVLLDGNPLVFKDENYYIGDGSKGDITRLGLTEYAPNYSPSLVSQLSGDRYMLSLWGHSELPEFSTIAIRPLCLGGDTVTYGEPFEIVLDRAANPANPCDVAYDADRRTLSFGALPVDSDGNGLAPWKYGYEVFVNNEPYTFSGSIYDLDDDIMVIPYEGFEYNYNFYLMTNSIYDETTWTLIDKKPVMEVSMLDEDLVIDKIGVRAVYTDKDGNMTCSEIINSDGSQGGVGVNAIGSDDSDIRWYDMQGVEVAQPRKGSIYIRIADGKASKVMF